jgi:hypothetical protein
MIDDRQSTTVPNTSNVNASTEASAASMSRHEPADAHCPVIETSRRSWLPA